MKKNRRDGYHPPRRPLQTTRLRWALRRVARRSPSGRPGDTLARLILEITDHGVMLACCATAPLAVVMALWGAPTDKIRKTLLLDERSRVRPELQLLDRARFDVMVFGRGAYTNVDESFSWREYLRNMVLHNEDFDPDEVPFALALSETWEAPYVDLIPIVHALGRDAPRIPTRP